MSDAVGRLPDPVACLPEPGAVLFDLDGTLVDTVATRIRAWSEEFERVGFGIDRDRLARLIGVDGRRLAREVAAVSGRTIDWDEAEEIDRRAGEIYERLNRDPRPLPGLKELVAALEERHVPWAIATSSRREQVKTSVAALELGREPTIVDGSHVEHAKPEPDLLLLGAKELNVDASTCWYVGDSTWDVAAAIAAGMVPIGVTAGAAIDAKVLAGAGAAVVVDTLQALVPAVLRTSA